VVPWSSALGQGQAAVQSMRSSAAASGGAKRRFSAQARQDLSVLAAPAISSPPTHPVPIPRTGSHQTLARRPGKTIIISCEPLSASVRLRLPSSVRRGRLVARVCSSSHVLAADHRAASGQEPAHIKAVYGRNNTLLWHLVNLFPPLP